jgi:hypothetical protein
MICLAIPIIDKWKAYMFRLRKVIDFKGSITNYILNENQELRIGLLHSAYHGNFYHIRYLGDRNKCAKILIKYTGKEDVYYLGNNLYQEVMFGISSKMREEKTICALFIRYPDVEKPPTPKVNATKVLDLKVIYDPNTYLPSYAIDLYGNRVELTDEIIYKRHEILRNHFGINSATTELYFKNRKKKHIFKRLKKD